MPTETITEKPEVSSEPKYSHKSFEMVFSTFCRKYDERLSSLTGRTAKDGSDNRFMGLPPNASVQQMGHRLNEAGELIGDSPRWEIGQQNDVEMRDALLLSARYVAWHATMGGITQQYVDRLGGHIKSAWHKDSLNGGGHQNLSRLRFDRARGLAILLAQNHALRDYFDSGLAGVLGNDSPEKMSQLLDAVPYVQGRRKQDLVRGISLEIASKRHLETLVAAGDFGNSTVAYGSDEQDARSGDLVLIAGDEVLFMDIKSSMPEKFSDGEEATDADYERGYKWLKSDDEEHKVVIWAYAAQPVEARKFELQDNRFEQNLRLVAASMNT